MSDARQHLHELINRLPEAQVTALAGLLETILEPLDPVRRAIANVPIDDEPVTEEERAAILRAEAWFAERGGKGIPMAEVLADFGLTMDDFPLYKEKRGIQD